MYSPTTRPSIVILSTRWAPWDSTFFAAEDNCNPWTFAVETEYEGEEIDPCNYSRFDTYTFTDCSDN